MNRFIMSLFVAGLFTASLSTQDGPEPELREVILPIVVAGIASEGRHYQTTISVANLGDRAESVTIGIYNAQGKLQGDFFCEPVGVFPPSPVEIPANGSYHRAGTSDRPLLDGWARLSMASDAKLLASAEVSLIEAEPQPCQVVCQFSSDTIVTSAQNRGLPTSREFHGAVLFTPNRHSAYALVNPSKSETAQVEVTTFRASGEVFDSNQFQIPPEGRISKLWWDLLNFGKVFVTLPVPPQSFHGSLRITSDLGIGVGGLHVLLPEGKFVNLPMEGS